MATAARLRDGDRILFETVYGSRAYGLASEGSDTDRRGVYASSPQALLGFADAVEQVEESPERVLWELRKLFRLAVACNPTAIETLFTSPDDHLVVTPVGRALLDERRSFLSKRAAESFGAYAFAQLKRIQTHRRWLLQPPQAKPTRAAFGLPERTVVARDQIGAAETLLARGVLAEADVSGEFMEVLDRERRYRAALREWQQHADWARTRNPERAALESRFGYDTKHAAHLLRLLRMGIEILARGEVLVRRPDAEELRAVRAGALSFDTLLEEAERLRSRLADARVASTLPEMPDVAALDRLCAELTARAHGWGEAARARTVGTVHTAAHVSAPEPATTTALMEGTRFLTAHPVAGQMVVGLTGSHDYGFPSHDSDLDLKGVHVDPTASVVSLDPPPRAVDWVGVFEGREIDFTTHELAFALHLLRRGNGNVIERVLTPWQLVESEGASELRALVRGALSRRVHRHYCGFFRRKRGELLVAAAPTAKLVLYCYRSALTGIHLLRTGECIGDVGRLADEHRFPAVRDLLQRKRAGAEKGVLADTSAFAPDLARLEADLAAAAEGSPLPEDTPNVPALSEFLVRQRRARWEHAG